MLNAFSKILLVLLVLTSLNGASQNLVPNHSFEDLSACPSDKGQISNASPWFEPLFQSADLFHECNQGEWSIGLNERGFQEPDTGKAYVYRNEDYDNSWEPNDLETGVYYYSLLRKDQYKNFKGWVKIAR